MKRKTYEYCSGAALCTAIEHVVQYIVVVESNGHCGLPKGHIEYRETQRAAALREVKEEIGAAATLADGFAADVAYELPSGNIKKTTYFIAAYNGREISCNDKDLLAVKLLPYEDAILAITYPNIKNIILQANEFIGKNGSSIKELWECRCRS